MIGARGLRSSCERIARNSVLRRSASRSASSARICTTMSAAWRASRSSRHRSCSSGSCGLAQCVLRMPSSAPLRLFRGVDCTARTPASRSTSSDGVPANSALASTSFTTTRSERRMTSPQVEAFVAPAAKKSRNDGPCPRCATMRSVPPSSSCRLPFSARTIATAASRIACSTVRRSPPSRGFPLRSCMRRSAARSSASACSARSRLTEVLILSAASRTRRRSPCGQARGSSRAACRLALTLPLSSSGTTAPAAKPTEAAKATSSGGVALPSLQ